jgi:hypothetical protein
MKELFYPLSKKIIDEIKNELRLQGHYDTGELERSFNELFSEKKGLLTLSATALGYLDELELGVDASKIDSNNIDIPKLASWVGRKIKPSGISNVQLAFLILKKWKKEGKPLSGSETFSKTGSTILAIEQVFQKNDSYTSEIDSVVYNTLDEEFFKTKSGSI